MRVTPCGGKTKNEVLEVSTSFDRGRQAMFFTLCSLRNVRTSKYGLEEPPSLNSVESTVLFLKEPMDCLAISYPEGDEKTKSWARIS